MKKKHRLSYFLLPLVILISSCSSVSNYVAKSTVDSCPYKLDDEKFDAQVSDSYGDKIIDSALKYEKFVNTKIVRETYDMIKIIREKNLQVGNFDRISADVIKLLQDEISNHKAIADYVTKIKSIEYGISSKEKVIDFIGKTAPENIDRGISIFKKYKSDLLKGHLPSDIILDGERVFFCRKDNKIISGTKDMNALIHVLYAIISVTSQNGDQIKPFVDSAYAFKILPLPRKFIVSDAYSKTQNSIYIQKLDSVNSYGFVIINTAYDEIYEFSRHARKRFAEDARYLPWYSQIFTINPDLNQEKLLAFYRIKHGQDYIAANIVNFLSEYNAFIKYFEPLNITNPTKQIKPGQIILIRDFVKTSVKIDEIVNGNSGTIGLIMDYDPTTKNAIILTDRENFGSKKTSLGFDVINLEKSVVERKYFIFSPKSSALNNNSEFSDESNIAENELIALHGIGENEDKIEEKNKLANDNYDIAANQEPQEKETKTEKKQSDEYQTLDKKPNKTGNLLTEKK